MLSEPSHCEEWNEKTNERNCVVRFGKNKKYHEYHIFFSPATRAHGWESGAALARACDMSIKIICFCGYREMEMPVTGREIDNFSSGRKFYVIFVMNLATMAENISDLYLII